MPAKINTYRVWMKDGYARLVNATSEKEARKIAIGLTKKDCQGMAMTTADKATATTVDYVQQLNTTSSNA